MKTIKKVAVTPMQENTGTIIDSFNTSDDKHTNAPSINAVEQKLSTVQTATVTATKNDIQFTINFKRNINVVTINVSMFIPSTVTGTAGWLRSTTDFTLPEWAKTSDNTVVNLDNTITAGGYSYNSSGVCFSSIADISLSRASSTDYRLMFLYRQADGTSYPEGQTLIANLKYIVID